MPGKHTMQSFDKALKGLRDELAELAGQVRGELDAALSALLKGDVVAAEDVIVSDRKANDMQEMIDRHLASVLARQQAVAGDLREILAAGRIAAHLERLGDYAKGMAKRTKTITNPIDPHVSEQFAWMAERVTTMLEQVMDAYARNDAEQANTTWGRDDELDDVYRRLFDRLLEMMQADRASIRDGSQLLLLAKNLERAGDHVTDIAEEVYFMVTGTRLKSTVYSE